MRIDCQVHTWSALAEGRVPSPNRDAATIRPRSLAFSNDELIELMDRAGVDRAVLYPPGWSAGGLKEAVDAVERYPDRLGVVPSLLPSEEVCVGPEEVDHGTVAVSRGQVARLLEIPNFLGVRVHFAGIGAPKSRDQPGVAAEPAFSSPGHWVWGELAESGIPVMVFPGKNLALVREIAASYPSLRLALDGLGISPDAIDGEVADAIAEVLPLSAYPNVAVKACHLPRLSSEPFPFANLHQVLCQVVAAFGRQRVFWGSNYTITKVPYEQSVELLVGGLECLSVEDIEWIMGEAVWRWLGWNERPRAGVARGTAGK